MQQCKAMQDRIFFFSQTYSLVTDCHSGLTIQCHFVIQATSSDYRLTSPVLGLFLFFVVSTCIQPCTTTRMKSPQERDFVLFVVHILSPWMIDQTMTKYLLMNKLLGSQCELTSPLSLKFLNCVFISTFEYTQMYTFFQFSLSVFVNKLSTLIFFYFFASSSFWNPVQPGFYLHEK